MTCTPRAQERKTLHRAQCPQLLQELGPSNPNRVEPATIHKQSPVSNLRLLLDTKTILKPHRESLDRVLTFWSYLQGAAEEGNGNPLQYSCLENPMDRGAWEAAAHGVAKSWTRLSNFTFTFHFRALEKEMATHSSVLAWRIPGTVEPGGLLSMGSHRVRHD